MSTLADTANLAIAALDLLLVQDLVGAIRAADLGALSSATSSPLAPLPAQSERIVDHYEPYAQPRSQECVTYCCERRRTWRCCDEHQPVLHPLPRVALEAPQSIRGDREPIDAVDTNHKSPIQPPWAVMAWQEPVNPPARVKVFQYRTDIVSKGTLIDTFI